NFVSNQSPAKNSLLAKDPRLFFEVLVTAGERYGFSFRSFTELPRIVRYLILQKEISGSEIMTEIFDLEHEVGRVLVETRCERDLYQIDEAFRHLNRLFHLAIEREEWTRIRRNQNTWSPAALYPRIQKLEQEIFQNPKSLRPISGAMLAHALNFYDLAYQREEALVQNSLAQMKTLAASKAVLITGGFHSDGIRAKLKRAGLGYLAIRPNVMELGEESRYLEVMLGTRKIMPSRPKTHTLAVPARLVQGQSDLAPMILRTLLDSSPEIAESSLFRSNPGRFVEGLQARLQRLRDKGVFNFSPQMFDVALARAASLGADGGDDFEIKGDPGADKFSQKQKPPKNDLAEFSVKNIAMWGWKEANLPTAAVWAKRLRRIKPEMHVYDWQENLLAVKKKNGEPYRQDWIREGIDAGVIKMNSFDDISNETVKKLIPKSDVAALIKDVPEDKIFKKLQFVAAQRLVLEKHSIIMLDAGFYLENESKHNRISTSVSEGFGTALKALRQKEQRLGLKPAFKIFVIRGFVPDGETDRFMAQVFKHSEQDTNFAVLYAPELLRIGNQMEDMEKHQVIIGHANLELLPLGTGKAKSKKLRKLRRSQTKAVKDLKKLLAPPHLPSEKVLESTAINAELAVQVVKLYSALKRAFMDTVGQVVDRLGGNLNVVLWGAASDRRIGSAYMFPSAIGFGGKLAAYVSDMVCKAGESSKDLVARLAREIKESNWIQKIWFQKKMEEILKTFPSLPSSNQLKVSLIGVAFKGNTGSVLASPVKDLIVKLVRSGVGKIYIYEPHAREEFELWVKEMRSERNADNVLRAAFNNPFYEFPVPAKENPLEKDVLKEVISRGNMTIIATDHDEVKKYLTPRLMAEAIKKQENPHPIIDARNIWGLQPDGTERTPLKEVAEAGLYYFSFGRASVEPGAVNFQEQIKVPYNQDAPFKKVAGFGTGYVGQIAGTFFADIGHEVTFLDADKNKIEGLNATPVVTIHEEGLEEIILFHRDKTKRLKFQYSPANTDDFLKSPAADVVRNADVIYVAVGTPESKNEEADLKFILGVTQNIGAALKEAKDKADAVGESFSPKVIVVKSTVESNAFAEMSKLLKEKFGLIDGKDIHIASNPEFLKEGKAVEDMQNPDRTVLGVESEFAARVSMELYLPFLKKLETEPEKQKRKSKGLSDHLMIMTDRVTSSTIKYVSNGFLNASISFANVMAHYVAGKGGSWEFIKRVIKNHFGSNALFLNPGCGIGGSCFPKDSKALRKLAKRFGIEFPVMDFTIDVNAIAPKTVVSRIVEQFSNAAGNQRGGMKTKEEVKQPLLGFQIGLLGVAFKDGTDDVRETPTLPILLGLLDQGAVVSIHDPLPKAVSNFIKDLARHPKTVELLQEKFPLMNEFVKRDSEESLLKVIDTAYDGRVRFAKTAEEAAQGSALVAILTDWSFYKNKLDPSKLIEKMIPKRVINTKKGTRKVSVIFDTRNLWVTNASKMEQLQNKNVLVMGTGEGDQLFVSAQAASLGYSVSEFARSLVEEWTRAQAIDKNELVNTIFSKPATISPDARETAIRIFSKSSNTLQGELIVPVEPQSSKTMRELLVPVAFALRGDAKKHVTIVYSSTAVKTDVKTILAELKVTPDAIRDFVHFKNSRTPLETYLIGRTAKFGEGRVVLIGDSALLEQVAVAGVRKISRDQVRTPSATENVKDRDRLVAQIAAIDLGLDLLASTVTNPHPDKLDQNGSMFLMKESFLSEFVGRWLAELHAQMAILIAA
ncbi:MAG: nucleotide sugar dehydrogenase, partial [Candidatus Omnitrophica bacterium]|nr:nucleotide sugar dehydrogenase [Candidatus Omnitrophota bacterium]